MRTPKNSATGALVGIWAILLMLAAGIGHQDGNFRRVETGTLEIFNYLFRLRSGLGDTEN